MKKTLLVIGFILTWKVEKYVLKYCPEYYQLSHNQIWCKSPVFERKSKRFEKKEDLINYKKSLVISESSALYSDFKIVEMY